MRRTRTLPPVTVPVDKIASELGDVFEWFDRWKAPRPATVKIWRRLDGGMTIRALGRTADGKRISYSMKISAG